MELAQEFIFLNTEEIVLACQLAEAAGANFVKTSTGFSKGGATLDQVRLMRKTVGDRLGVKASGGIRDRKTLIQMIDAGANRAITQFVFDSDFFLRYRDLCAARGIRASIVPGILPITRFPQLVKVAKRCGASVPDWLHTRFSGLDDDPETRRMIAANVAIEQVQYLRRHGVEEFHFYTLNRAELTYAICHALGLRPQLTEARVA